MKKTSLFFVLACINLHTFAQTLDDARRELDKENYIRAKNMLHTMLGSGIGDKTAIAYYIGTAYQKLDEPDSAKMYFMMPGADNKTAYGYLAAGRLAVMKGDKAKAKEVLEKAAVTSRMKNSEILYQIAETWYKPTTLDLNEAIRNFEDAYKLDNKNLTNMIALGDAYLDNGEGGKALSKYESAAEVNPKLTMAFVKIGRLNARGRIWDDAITAFKKASALEPDYAVPHKELYESYFLSKQYDKAKPEFKRYIELNKEDADAKSKFVSFLFSIKEYDQCATEATQMLASDANNFVLMRASAYANYELKRYKEGLEYAKRFWVAAPTAKIRPLDYVYTAKLATQNQDTALALKYFNQALAIDTNNGELLSDYSKLMWSTKRYPEAIANYTKKIARFGGTFYDYYYIGRSNYAIANSMKTDKAGAVPYYVAADSAFAQVTVKYPTQPDGWQYRAKCNNNLDPEMKTGGAKPFYEEFIKVAEKATDPSKYKRGLVEAYDYLGAHALNGGDKGTARGYFTKSLELDPNDELAKELSKGL
jgi:tetratricopeptide (TPR) repeat protein